MGGEFALVLEKRTMQNGLVGFMELFVAANYLFRQIQENECTLLRWINLGTCKGPSQSMYERKLFACFVCHIKISQTTRFLVTFLILLENLR